MSSKILETFTTIRNTKVEFVEDSKFGTICYMNGQIQSATLDEKLYHKFFSDIASAYTENTKDVLIIGGGEGCLAREILAHKTVRNVTMVDWDKEVIDVFKSPKYANLWAGESTWTDPRLRVDIDDAWLWTKNNKARFDLIFVDLFDPETSFEGLERWENLLVQLRGLLNLGGTMVVYCGMSGEDVYQETDMILNSGEFWRGIEINGTQNKFKEISRYQVNVPSFEGEAVFIKAENYLGLF